MKKTLPFLILLAFVLVITNSCRKGTHEDVTPNPNNNGTVSGIYTSISGMVMDENKKPMTGVTVTVNGSTIKTDAFGLFYFENVNVDDKRCIVQFYQAGYYMRSHAFIPKANSVNYVNAMLMSRPSVQTISSSSGGTITTAGGASVQFTANSISKADGSKYSGTVNVAVKQLSTDAPGFGMMIPGGDLAAKSADNKDVILYSYGMLGVELTGSSGEPLKISSGSTAILNMPVASSQLSSAPSSIALWYFDEVTALWKEEGSATLTGSIYVGTVSHFTWWNCDRGGPRCPINGNVIDGRGHSLPNVVVSFTQGYTFTLTTDQNGNFQSWWPASMPFTVQVIASNSLLGISSQQESVPALADGQTYVIPPLICGNPANITGRLKGCNLEDVNGRISAVTGAGSVLNYAIVKGGAFDMEVPPATTLTLIASTKDGVNSTTITSPQQNATTDAGDIKVCDHIATVKGSFHMKIYGLDTTITADATISFAKDTLNGKVLVKLRSTFGSITELDLVAFTTDGNYNIQSGSGLSAVLSMEYYSYYYSSVNQATNLNLAIVNTGGTLKGTFNGTIATTKSDPNYPDPAIITGGQFEVFRNY